MYENKFNSCLLVTYWFIEALILASPLFFKRITTANKLGRDENVELYSICIETCCC